MADFHVSIPEAVNAVQPLLRTLGDAQRECQEAIRYVQSLGERLKQDRAALQEAATALETLAREKAEEATAHVANATANFDRVKEVVQIALEEWGETCEREGRVLVTACESLPELTAGVTAMAEKVEKAGREALEWATTLSQKIHGAVEGVEQAVTGGLAKLVDDWRREAEAETARVLDFLDQCEELLITKEAEWRDKMPPLQKMVEEAFEGIADHQDEVVAYGASRWEQLFSAQFESTQKEAGKLAARLSSLGQAVANYEGQLQVAGRMIGERQDKAAAGAAELRQELAQVRAHWDTLGIDSCTTPGTR
jgi:hypothetical protein